MISKKTLYPIIVFALIYSIPLILFNPNYNDDMGRNLEGYGWNADGRFLATLIMQFFSFGKLITGLFPYSIILSSILLISSAYLIIDVSSKFTQTTKLLISFTILASPLTLEILSYRYDSILMALSIFFCALPFLFFNDIKNFFLISLICLLFAGLTYQPSLAVFALCTLILVSVLSQKDFKKSLLFALTAFLAFVFIILTIYLILKLQKINFYGNQVTLSLSYLTLINRFYATWGYIYRSLNFYQSLIYLSIGLVAIVSIYKSCINSKKKLMFFLFLLILLSFVVNAFLTVFTINTPIVARVLIGFPFIFIFLFSLITTKWEFIIRFFCFLLILISISMVSAYSIALNSQYEFEKNVMLTVFSSIDPTDKLITIEGQLPYADSVNIRNQNFPIIKQLNHINMIQYWPWGDSFLKTIGLIKSQQYITGPIDFKNQSEQIISNKCKMNFIKSSLYYNLYTSDKAVLIDFTKSVCNKAF